METILIVVAVGVVAWFLLSRQRKEEQADARRADLQVLLINENEVWGLDSDVTSREWSIDFPSMRARHQQTVYDPDLTHLEFSRIYELRKTPAGVWEARLTRRDFDAAMMDFARECREKPDADLDDEARAERQEQKEDFERGPRWEPMPDGLASRIETGYQRYVRQG